MVADVIVMTMLLATIGTAMSAAMTDEVEMTAVEVR